MISICLKKKIAKFLIFVILIINTSPVFTMEMDPNNIDPSNYRSQRLVSPISVEYTDNQISIAIRSILDASENLLRNFVKTIEGIGQFIFDENNNISISINSDLGQPLKIISDYSVVFNLLRNDDTKIIAPSVKFHGEAFLRSLEIEISAPDGSVEIEENSILSSENVSIISSNSSDNFNFFNQGIITGNTIFLCNIDCFYNEGDFIGNCINLYVNELKNLTKIDGTILTIIAYNSILNHGEIKSENAEFNISNTESIFYNYGVMTFDNFSSNSKFENNTLLHVNHVFGTGEIKNNSQLTPYMNDQINIGIRKFVNANQNIFDGTLRFIDGIEIFENRKILSATSIIFESERLKVKNEENATIKAANKIEGRVESFENKGNMLSENSLISLFFETFINHGQVGALNGVIFKGNILKNYTDLSLTNPKIEHLFNGKSITEDEADETFLALIERQSKNSAEQINNLPKEDQKKAIANILEQVSSTTNIPQNDIDVIKIYYDALCEALALAKESEIHEYQSTYRLVPLAGWNGMYSTWRELEKNPKTEKERLITDRILLYTNTYADAVTREITTINSNAAATNGSFDARVAQAKTKLESIPFPLQELYRVILAYNKRSMLKGATNLRIHSGSSIKTLENFGHTEFFSGINPIDRYIGTEASELLIASVDNPTAVQNNTAQMKVSGAKDRVILAGKNIEIVDTEVNATDDSLIAIPANEEEYRNTIAAVSFGILEGGGKFYSHKMKLPNWQLLNAATFMAEEMEIIGAINNTKNIALPMTKLILNMQGSDFCNSKEIVCKELFVKECNTFENKGIIEAYGDIKVQADSILNVGEPDTVQKSTSTVEHDYMTADISAPRSNPHDPCLYKNPNIFNQRTYGKTFLRSQYGKLTLIANKSIKNSFSSIVAFNSFNLEVLDGTIENKVGRIYSISNSNSHIKAKHLDQHLEEFIKKNVGSYQVDPKFLTPAYGYFNTYDESEIYSGGNLHLETPLPVGGRIYAPIVNFHSEKNEKILLKHTSIDLESLGINADSFLARFGLRRLSETGEIVELDSNMKKYSISSIPEPNLRDFIARANEDE